MEEWSNIWVSAIFDVGKGGEFVDYHDTNDDTGIVLND